MFFTPPHRNLKSDIVKREEEEDRSVSGGALPSFNCEKSEAPIDDAKFESRRSIVYPATKLRQPSAAAIKRLDPYWNASRIRLLELQWPYEILPITSSSWSSLITKYGPKPGILDLAKYIHRPRSFFPTSYFSTPSERQKCITTVLDAHLSFQFCLYAYIDQQFAQLRDHHHLRFSPVFFGPHRKAGKWYAGCPMLWSRYFLLPTCERDLKMWIEEFQRHGNYTPAYDRLKDVWKAMW